MYNMKNEIAIIMAAGMGSRLLPITETVPKPLVRVSGVPMIETIIQALRGRGVEDIYIVVGYKREQFNYLTQKYEGLFLVENQEYNIKNNISSLLAVVDLLDQSDCFICEADLYITDCSVFKVNLEESCYFGRMVKGDSQDWVFELSANGLIRRVGKVGTDCYNMVGVSYWKQKDAKVLANKLREACSVNGNEQMYWDDVVNMNLKELPLRVKEVETGQIIEIDTKEELMQVDASYKQ